MHIKRKLIRKGSIFAHKFLRKKENGFNHVISLGYNCEVSFRFLKYFNFEESSLFNWTYSYSIDDLINALKNLDCIGNESFQLPNPLWECNKTHIRFHGKENMGTYIRKEDTPEIRKKDMEELSSRIQHLKEKFIEIAQNDDTKLYVYKLQTKDINDNTEEKLLQLYRALLHNVKAKNFKLLIVYEKQEKPIKENNNYILRTVKYFAPDGDVTGKKYMNNGWDKIFHEFFQNKKLNKNHKKYKFDTTPQRKFNKKYDLIFGIGAACSCTQTLRKRDLQLYSYPFDWLFGSDFVGRCKILALKFNKFIEKDDLEDIGKTNLDIHNLCEIYYNKYNDLTFNHDFPINLNFDEAYLQVKEKYNRRINRLLSQIENSSKILILYIETPNTDKHTSDENIIAGLDIIHQKYPDKKIDLLYFMNDTQMQPKQFTKQDLSENVIKITANYKSQEPNDVPYAVDKKFLVNLLSEYDLNIPYTQKIKAKFLKYGINCIPFKSLKKKLRKKYHVK